MSDLAKREQQNKIRQWLLIGGPAHGKVLNIKGGTEVLYSSDNDGAKYYSYTSRLFALEGKLYQLGICSADTEQLDPRNIREQIRSTCLEEAESLRKETTDSAPQKSVSG